MRAALAVLTVVALSLLGARVGLGTYTAEHDLSAGTIVVGTDVGHEGALDIYVPLVDWGLRFDGVRLPARLTVDVRSVDRHAATRLAVGDEVPVHELRDEATTAITSYITTAVFVVAAAALALGALSALALRASVAPVRRLLAVALATSLACGAAVALGLPPRGELRDPEYYARGPDIPVALQALQDATRSADRLEEELDSQLVGLARLVEEPGRRPALDRLPRLVLASDLHNGVLALPALERAARDKPLIFAGDLTDSGSALESELVRRVTSFGRPFVFVAGNHDSDALEQRLARAGAVVLRHDGVLRRDGTKGPVVARVAGLRIAGYESPNRRLRILGFDDRGAEIDDADRRAFRSWLLGLAGKIDVAVVHEPELIGDAAAVLAADVTLPPLLLLAGHTHRTSAGARGNVALVNGGSIGAGGTGNLDERTGLSLAVVTYRRGPFTPLAADTVTIDPASGAARAQRTPLVASQSGPDRAD